MAYQYNAVGSAPKILGQTFIVDKLEQLADNGFANRLGTIKVSPNASITEGEVFSYGQLVPVGTSTSSTYAFGTITTEGVAPSLSTFPNLYSCVVDGKTYYGYKNARYCIGSGNGPSYRIEGQTMYCLIYRYSTQQIELLYTAFTNRAQIRDSSNSSYYPIHVSKQSDDIVLALWCGETA